MDSIDTPFIININGKPIAKAVENGEDHIHASVGSDAAIVSLKDGKLTSGDWVLSRFPIEDMSLLPKRVFWMRTGSETNHSAFAEKHGDSFRLKIGGAPLMLREEKVYVQLIEMGDELPTIELIMQ